MTDEKPPDIDKFNARQADGRDITIVIDKYHSNDDDAGGGKGGGGATGEGGGGGEGFVGNTKDQVKASKIESSLAGIEPAGGVGSGIGRGGGTRKGQKQTGCDESYRTAKGLVGGLTGGRPQPVERMKRAMMRRVKEAIRQTEIAQLERELELLTQVVASEEQRRETLIDHHRLLSHMEILFENGKLSEKDFNCCYNEESNRKVCYSLCNYNFAYY